MFDSSGKRCIVTIGTTRIPVELPADVVAAKLRGPPIERFEAIKHAIAAHFERRSVAVSVFRTSHHGAPYYELTFDPIEIVNIATAAMGALETP